MKFVFSRKGFDSSAGGCASPIAPDGRMVSLPIPGGVSPARYRDIATPLGPMGLLAHQLSRGRVSGHHCAHLDPDLDPSALPRQPGWLASLGQVNAAQSHLEGQGVGIGDVFLFFGWFREAEETADGWAFRRGAPDRHVLFGYLQVGEQLLLGPDPDTRSLLAERPWLDLHPHSSGHRHANNTLHVASPNLVLNGRDTGLPGAAAFSAFHEELVLTAPGAPKSLWRVPKWLGPAGAALSYHKDPDRWKSDPRDPDQHLLQSVAKGQEFVFDGAGTPAEDWFERLARTALPPAPRPRRARP